MQQNEYRMATKARLDNTLANLKADLFNGGDIPQDFANKVRDLFAPYYRMAEALDMGGSYFVNRTLAWVDVSKVVREWQVSEAIKRDGAAYFSIWSRDCDMCESTRTTSVKSLKAYHKMMEGLAENAEGPVSCELISREQYKQFTPSFRDRVMENRENGGNGYWL